MQVEASATASDIKKAYMVCVCVCVVAHHLHSARLRCVAGLVVCVLLACERRNGRGRRGLIGDGVAVGCRNWR